MLQVACTQKKSNMRTINIAGLVVDSENLKPISGVNIYDYESEIFLITTDENGYFKSKLDVNEEGEIQFSLKINAEKYDSLIQKERWGDLPGNHSTVYYFGLKDKKSESKSFSELSFPANGTSYENVLEGFEVVKEKVNFRKKMHQALEGNQDVFFQVDGNFYIVSDTGWIKLKSEEELISINGNKIVSGKEINDVIKRNNITGMSPSESENMDYIIYTRE
tara:strand:+ start:4070 stop:4732 length:663 start_codon:yes stop_codon:yes gene_type:complete